MKAFLIAYLSFTGALMAQTGRIAGTVTDNTGAIVAGAVVTANLQPSSPLSNTFQPYSVNALSDLDGHFAMDSLKPGVYRLCVEKAASDVLNPCVWSDSPATAVVSPGSTTGGVTVVALQGVTITVRLLDMKGLLTSNPQADDLLIGAGHNRSPFTNAVVTTRSAYGKTMRLVVPAGQPVSLSVFTSGINLGDDAQTPFGSKRVLIPLSAAQTLPAANREVTLHVLGLTGSTRN